MTKEQIKKEYLTRKKIKNGIYLTIERDKEHKNKFCQMCDKPIKFTGDIGLINYFYIKSKQYIVEDQNICFNCLKKFYNSVIDDKEDINIYIKIINQEK